MRWRVLFWSVWLFLAVAFSVRFIFADDEPCYDCQNCWENIINCATNGGNCSSNCVKFSPSDCSNFVNGVLAELETITGSVYVIIGNVDSFIEFIDDTLIPSVDDSLLLVSSSLSSLDNYSSSNSVSLSSAVNELRVALDRMNYVVGMWENVDGSSGSLFVSNLSTHVSQTIGISSKITIRLQRQIIPNVQSALSILSDLQSYSFNEIASVRSDLQLAYSALLDVQDYLKVYPSLLATAKDNANTVLASSLQLRSYVDTVNCEPCGRGGGGSGGSGGGTVDFTGVSAQLDEIKTLLQQVYDLIYNYYTDYNYARNSRPSGQPSYQGYVSLGDNWFKRIEYLLYSSSPVASNNLEGAESPDTIEGQTAFESETTQLEESVDTITGGFDQSLSRPWSKFSDHFSQFWDRLNAFKLPGQSSGQLGQLEWSHLDILSYSKDGHGFTLQAQSDLDGFPSVWYKFAVGFRVLWFLLTLTLYCLFFVFMIKYSFKVAAFVIKLLNTSFGSG